jgi:type II secretory pathway component PulF
MSQFRWPGFDSLRRLSPEETADLAARVAELSKAGLPLGEGLRGLAAESSSRRLSRVLGSMADDLDAGADLATAIDSQGRRLPPHLRGLILAGLRTGHLAEALEEYVDLQRSHPELGRRLTVALAYPLVLLAVLTLLAVLGNWWIVKSFAAMYKDFNVDLPYLTAFVLFSVGPVTWTLIILMGVLLTATVLLAWGAHGGWLRPVAYRVPMIGPILQYSDVSQFARLMGLLLGQEVPLPDALRLSADGLRDPGLARGCREMADEVERGRALDESMAARPRFPASMIPLVQWGQRTPAMAEAFRSAAEMFEGRVRVDDSLIEAVLPPIILMLVTIVVGFCTTGLFLPLIKLIESLSSSKR